VKPGPRDFAKFRFTQRGWRTVGAASLAVAGAMALYAVSSGLLRRSVLHVAAWSSPEAAESLPPGASGQFHFLYWSFFALLILVALYMALLDIRYIRLQFLLEKREIFGKTLGDKEFRRAILNLPPKQE
jgi:hypothetical protein